MNKIQFYITKQFELKLKDSGVDLNNCVFIIKGLTETFIPVVDSEYKCIDRNCIEISGKRYNVVDIAIKRMTEVSTDYLTKDMAYNKSTKVTLPHPSKKIHPLINAVLIAIRDEGGNLPITNKQHQRKMSTIRMIKKMEDDPSKNVSISKLDELLNFYGLSFLDIIKKDKQIDVE